MKHRIP